MEVSGKKFLVMGAGRSGVAAARFLNNRGGRVALADRKPLDKWSEAALNLKTEGVGLVPEDVPSWLLDQIEVVVLSPGVPTSEIAVRYAERARAEVIGEVELASRFLRGGLIAITGSNGKTTTTTLVGEVLSKAGVPTVVGGNIGTPLISLVDESHADGWTVAEISSFQLETTRDFHPQIAAVLNLTPDHMERYESMTDYAAAKHRIFRCQTESDVAVLNADDEIVRSWAQGLRAHKIFFSSQCELDVGIFKRDSAIVFRNSEGERVLHDVRDMKLRGKHNIENVMAAFAIGIAAGVPCESISRTVRSFAPVEHRLEFVANVDGVEFYNDSKATNVDAALKALEAFKDATGKIVLIIGGRGKNAPYAPLLPLVGERVRKLVIIGEDADRIERELGGATESERAGDMAHAVQLAHNAAQPGDAVLLAPACASFDMFTSFEHRGRVFKEEVFARMKDEG